jgi:hypothetical protein
MMHSGGKNSGFGSIAKWFFVLLFLMLSFSAVQAEQGLAVVPSSITINATAAFPLLSTSNQTRTVILNATEDITNLNFMPLDLTTGDGQAIIPQKSITAQINTTRMEKGTFLSVPISFDLGLAPGGTYSGEVWFTYANGNVTKIPVNATVKANAWLAVLLLFITVFISYGLAYYNAKYKKGDEIRKALDLIKSSIEKDGELKNPHYYGIDPEPTRINKYYEQINRDIANTEEQLQSGDFTKADTFFKELTTTFNSWRDDRSNLIPLFNKYDELIKNLNILEKDIKKFLNEPQTTIQLIASMRNKLQENFDGILSDKGQKTLDTTIASCVNIYEGLTYLIPILKGDTTHLPNPDINNCPGCKFRYDCWEAIKGMQFDGDTNKKLTDFIKGINDPKNKHSVVVASAFAETREVKSSILGKVYQTIEPLIRSSSPLIGPGRSARIRLFLSEYLAFAIVIVLLMYAGFNQLYYANPTFGASLLDWGTLAIWGLMAGPTADAISQQTKTKLGIS